MKVREVIVQAICFVLSLSLLIEGTIKLAYFNEFGVWLYLAPLLKHVSGILKFLIPGIEITVAVLLFFRKYRVFGLYSMLFISLIFILYIMANFLFIHRIFQPFVSVWKKPDWIQKMIIALVWAWLAFTAIVLDKSSFSFKRNSSTLLRNTPAGTGQGG